MPMRLIQFHGSISGKRSWLTPVLVLLVAIGAAVALLAAVFLGAIMLAAGSAVRLLKGAAGSAERSGSGASTSLLGRLMKKIFGPARTASVSTPPAESPDAAPPRTISLDRGKDGIWRP